MTVDLPTIDTNDPLVKAVKSVQEFADEHVKTLEHEGVLCEDAEGREGYYHMSEKELWLVTDAINGLIADEDFLRLARTEVVEREKQRARDGQCIICGCMLPEHWGIRPECTTQQHCDGLSK